MLYLLYHNNNVHFLYTNFLIWISLYIYIYILPVKSIWSTSKIFIFHPKSVIFNEIRVSSAFQQELPEVSYTYGCLAQIYQLNSSHTCSIGFKSPDCIGQDISWRTCCSSLLLMYHWQNLQICFGSLSCISTNPWNTSHIPVCCDNQSDSIYPSPFIGKSLHTITDPSSCFAVGVIQEVAALSPTFHHI